MKKIIHWKHYLLFFSITILFLQPTFAAKNLNTYFNFSVNYDDLIVNNKIYSQASLSTKLTQGINRNSNFSTRIGILKKQYTELSNEDRDQIELQLAYNYQASQGYFSPTYSIQLKAINEKGNNDIETDKISLTFLTRKPLTNKVELSLGFKKQDHTGSSPREINSVFINTDFFLSHHAIIYTGLNVSTETTSSISTSSNTPSIDHTNARPSDISSHHPIPVTSNPNSSESESDGKSFSLGVIYQVDSHHTFDALYRINDYDSESSLNNVIKLDYFYKF